MATDEPQLPNRELMTLVPSESIPPSTSSWAEIVRDESRHSSRVLKKIILLSVL